MAGNLMTRPAAFVRLLRRRGPNPMKGRQEQHELLQHEKALSDLLPFPYATGLSK